MSNDKSITKWNFKWKPYLKLISVAGIRRVMANLCKFIGTTPATKHEKATTQIDIQNQLARRNAKFMRYKCSSAIKYTEYFRWFRYNWAHELENLWVDLAARAFLLIISLLYDVSSGIRHLCYHMFFLLSLSLRHWIQWNSIMGKYTGASASICSNAFFSYSMCVCVCCRLLLIEIRFDIFSQRISIFIYFHSFSIQLCGCCCSKFTYQYWRNGWTL